ncbi:MAG TPA: metallophosphoesterase family protein, partial [Edaphobacter sp.]|nr:metallophosphoesterase family protein [Edaphobacter sp.]
ELAGRLFYMVHSLADLDIHPSAAGVAAVISGHSHKPLIEHRSGVMYLNPGSAGPRRFNLPITLALMTVANGEVSARIVELLR